MTITLKLQSKESKKTNINYFNMKLTHKERKDIPVFTGFLNYFPDAIREVAKASRIANDQHNPNTPVHWDRSKSGDELDALARHLLECGTMDDDNILHSTKVAWRAMANLQKELEERGEAHLSTYNHLEPKIK